MNPISDILKERKVEKSRSERADLIKFFVDNLWNKNNKNYPAKRIAIALAHVPTQDIYFMISVAKDIMARRGVEAMNKWFWWSLKCK